MTPAKVAWKRYRMQCANVSRLDEPPEPPEFDEEPDSDWAAEQAVEDEYQRGDHVIEKS